MEEIIHQWQYWLLAILLLLLLFLWVTVKINRLRLRKKRDFTRRLETLLLPKEELRALCPGPHGQWVLTNQRLIMEAGEGFTAFPFSKIKKVSGVDETGKATVAAAKMAVLTVKTADQEFYLPRRKKGDFTQLVKGLKAGVSREKSKQKKKETGKKQGKKPESTKK